MRKSTMLSAALVGVFAVSVAAAVVETSHELTGTLKAIDAKDRAISVDTGKGIETFKLHADARVLQESTQKNLDLSSLRVGERVHLFYRDSGSDRMVSRLQVLSTVHAANSRSKSPASSKP